MARKSKLGPLTFAQTCMTANFYDAACDFPNLTFGQITEKVIGKGGFPKTKNVALFRSECREAFNLAMGKQHEHRKGLPLSTPLKAEYKPWAKDRGREMREWVRTIVELAGKVQHLEKELRMVIRAVKVNPTVQ